MNLKNPIYPSNYSGQQLLITVEISNFLYIYKHFLHTYIHTCVICTVLSILAQLCQL